MPTVLSKPILAGYTLGLVGLAVGIRHAGNVAARRGQLQAVLGAKRHSDASKDRIAVNGVFFRKLWKLLKVLVPGVFSAEFGFAVAVALLLITRTYADVWMIHNQTAIESSVIMRDSKQFGLGVAKFFLGLLPISCVNNALKYTLMELQVRFRERLTRHLLGQYLTEFTYYKTSNVDNRIANVDQLLTQDVDLFCKSVTEVYSNISKPLLDMALFAYKLSGSIGSQGPLTMMGYLLTSGAFLTWLRRPVGLFTVNEQRLEGHYRHVHSRLITSSEEIAFYDGNRREKWVMESVFASLMAHIRRAQQFRFSLGVVDTFVAKYFATIVGFYVVSRPFFAPGPMNVGNGTHAELMQHYYQSGRMLLHMAQAVGRLVLAGRELTRLAGFTARVSDLVQVLDDLNAGVYQRTMVDRGASHERSTSRVKMLEGKLVEADHVIKFVNVPLMTPNRDLLVPSLSMEVRSGMNVLVCGPNGCGKSSLFRVLGGLWPLAGGELTKPHSSKLFYIPQRPYLTLGTLRDQVIYPDSKQDMEAKGITDADLLQLLSEVRLTSLVEREHGWDEVQDWADTLSGGEKQRVAMARVFYHKPQFAILDECTSAVSVDVEGAMYTRCKELNITLFTVSHRKSLWKYHEWVLEFDGRGSYSFREMGNDELQFGS